MVNWDGVPTVFSRCVEYLMVLFPWFDEDVLWHDEAMWDKVLELMWYMEDINVTFFFVHGGNDLVQSTRYGCMVSILPVE